jgi:hypothetical protein
MSEHFYLVEVAAKNTFQSCSFPSPDFEEKGITGVPSGIAS